MTLLKLQRSGQRIRRACLVATASLSKSYVMSLDKNINKYVPDTKLNSTTLFSLLIQLLSAFTYHVLCSQNKKFIIHCTDVIRIVLCCQRYLPQHFDFCRTWNAKGEMDPYGCQSFFGKTTDRIGTFILILEAAEEVRECHYCNDF